ncbi:MAG: MmgE/PrpD family protein, partial [Lachnospiraceae bacterium]|nr:MmgE/PrpD family protein [Candidatus Hippenecus merdae]
KIDIYSFGNAGTLYREAPKNEDEAMYNIIYPIAAAVIFGICGPLESSTTRMLDPRVAPMIEKIEFHHEPEYDKVFPAQRLSRSEVTTKDGRKFVSRAFEPRGDHNADVTMEDLTEKLRWMNTIYADEASVDAFLSAVRDTKAEEPFETVYGHMKKVAKMNIHPEIKFI